MDAGIRRPVSESTPVAQFHGGQRVEAEFGERAVGVHGVGGGVAEDGGSVRADQARPAA